jgi:ribose transport system permease protein
MKKKHTMTNMMSICILVVLFIMMMIGTNGKLISLFNLQALLDQSFSIMIAGLGMIFVIAQGGTDMSQGSLLAIAGTLGVLAAEKMFPAMIFPVAIAIGALIGILNGVLVAKLKVSSFMVTLAMLIALRALTTYIVGSGVIMASKQIRSLDSIKIKVPVLIICIIIISYLFEFTKFGYYCRAIGENEQMCYTAGIPVQRIKILAFTLSGIMTGIASVFTVSGLGGASSTIGKSFELNVMVAIFIGGVLVTGGMETHIYKLFIGVPTVAILQNGLVILGVSGNLVQAIVGIILITIVFLMKYFDNHGNRELKVRGSIHICKNTRTPLP